MRNPIPIVLTSLVVLNLPTFTSAAETAQLIRTTAYTHTEADHLKYGRQTASGTLLRSTTRYNSAAADWSEFPLGTTFRIKGEPVTYVIDDYGSALVGTRTIDIYRPTKTAMNHWGVRHVEVEFIAPGSFEKSKTILAGRQRFNHCRRMFEAIQARDPQEKVFTAERPPSGRST